MAADTLLCNLTAGGSGGAAITCIRVETGRIIGLGGKDGLDYLRGSGTRLLDCQGGVVLPGFNDAHCHPLASPVA